jgi:hypothetical protein
MSCCSQKTKAVAAVVLLGSFLAGCSDIYYDRRETVSFAANDATASAQATQTIDPWPRAGANRNIESNGARVAGAIERYRTGQIIQPKGMSTSSAGYAGQAQSQQGGGGPSTTSAASSAK